MPKTSHKILFLGKQEDPYCAKALEFCQSNFAEVTGCLGVWGDPLPRKAVEWSGDYIISYLSRWVVPATLLERAEKAAFNFHPASPDYPGIGCNNFALYENATEYGVTCHHMEAKVDTGAIIAVKRFPVHLSDDVASLLTRTYEHQLELFFEIVGGIASGQPLPSSQEKWTRKPFTRQEFNQLFVITPDMSEEEITRRIRATRYKHWRPYVVLGGHTFELADEEDR
ncbi:MAG: formyltransferase family protein [Anaerolineales bacterium]